MLNNQQQANQSSHNSARYELKLSPYANTFYIEWQLNPDSSRYNLVIDQILYGSLEVAKLKHALHRYITEHIILNSHIRDINNVAYWVPNQQINELEYTETPVATSELLKYVKRSFDLHHGPLYRFKLVRLQDNVYRFIAVFHHLLVDGSSSLDAGVFTAIANYYNDDNYTTQYSIPEQIDLITKLTTTLTTKLAEQQPMHTQFWRQHLADTSNVDLGFLKLASKVAADPAIATVDFSYDASVLAQLKQLKSQYAVTPYLFSKCIFAMLLHRYTGQERITISYPIAIKEGLDFIYGAQINTNLITYQFQSETTVAAILNQSREFFHHTIRSDIQHGYQPIADIMNSCDNKNLLDVSFTQTYFREQALEFNGITQVELHTELGVDGAAAEVFLFEQDARNTQDQLNCRIRYDKNTIDTELLNNFIASYQQLFVAVLTDLLANDSQKLVASYDILSPEQYQKIVYEFNQTKVAYPCDKTIHQLFEEQVLKTPNNIAVVYENTKLTYQELNQKANQLAHYLQQNYCIQPDDLVALCLDRSEQMLIAIFGVLKAGGAYVPIDPNYPDERIGYAIGDTKTKAILTKQIYVDKLQQIITQQNISTNILAINNQELKNELNNQDINNPTTFANSNNLAYVIYTSGTTGNPKGVMIEHSSLVNFSKYASKFITTQDNVMSYINYSFDAINAEIYPTLLSGNSLYILNDTLRHNINDLYQFIIKNNITFMVLPAVIATEFSLNYDIGATNLKTIIIGGDVYRGKLDQVQIINQYGPTEATICTTLHEYKINDLYTNIGKPINNATCYVLDKNLNILPIGAIGELYIGGQGLARGYLNNPKLTAEKFISNPLQTSTEKLQEKNARLYKTGDLARWLPDGNLEYIGRNDSQVKIRGYRIELGEIENKILSYLGVEQTIVLAKERSSERGSDKYLLAYYVSAEKLDEEKLKAYLATQLPEYMLPQILIHINKLPLTINGKIDKKALPEPNLIKQLEYIPPRNKLEQQLCEMYAKVLGLPVEQVGITSDFFQIGGDSISAIQLVYQIRQKLALNLSVASLFTYRNIEQLVKNVLTNQNIQKNTTSVKKEDHPIGKSDFLPIQEWFFNNIKNGSYEQYNHWNQSFAIKTPELDIEILKLSIEKLFEQHDAFRLRYKNFEKSYIKIDLAKEAQKIKNIDVTNLTDAEIKNKLIAIQSNFNIETGPVYVIAYLHGYPDKTARLFFAMHHLIVDSVSWRILANDIARLYELLQDQGNTNKTSQALLGQKGTSYRQWVETVKNYQPSQQELNHWDDILTDYTHVPKNSNEVSHCEFFLSSELTQKLLIEANAAYNTQVNDLLLAALSKVLAQVFNRQTNHITLEGHGREEINPEIDITKTMGWFTTMYPVKLVDQPTIAELIKTTKANLKNIPNKGIGYGPIKGYSNLPNISFNYLGQISTAEGFWAIVDHIISTDPTNQNGNILDVYGYIINGALRFHISCNNNLPFNAKIFTDKFKTNLEELIEYCCNQITMSKKTMEEQYQNTQNEKITGLLDQVKISYASKPAKNHISEHLQHKIDCYLNNAHNQPSNLFLPKPIVNILLTGSTGFLGCNLLNQLLKLTNYNIFLLVRAESQTVAIERINKKFQFYFDKTLDDVYGKRVFVLKSDLTVNDLGLSEREYQDLTVNIDSVIHAAALVSLYGNYDNFYLHNVQATINLLEFTRLTKLKDFHYVSTFSVLDGNCDLICTEDDMPSSKHQDNVYLKTKIQSEHQIIKYRDYGITSNIYRVGTLAFIAENLRTQENITENGFLNWVKYLFRLKSIAKEISSVNVSPVDLTAEAIVKLFDKHNLSNQTYHVFNPHLFDMSSFVSRDNKCKLAILSIDKFIDQVTNEIEYNTYDNLSMKFLLYQGWMDDFYTKNINTIQLRQDRTQFILKLLDFTWSQTTIRNFFDKYYKATLK